MVAIFGYPQPLRRSRRPAPFVSVAAASIRDVPEPIVGREAINSGILTRGKLRWNYTAVHPGVYVPNDAERTMSLRATAAWLWTGRRAVIAGRAAAALHGAKWIDALTPIELIVDHTRRRPGIIVREEWISTNEITFLGDLPVTTVARTALDLARHLPRDEAVAHLDALAAGTGVHSAQVTDLAEKHRGTRGIRRAHIALNLMDGGAQSPQETRLRLLLIDDGLPPPRTQVRVTDGVATAFIDMGYDEPKVGLDYEGLHHSENRDQYVHDITRADLIDREGWIDILVVKEHSERFILERVHDAARRLE